MEEVALGDEWRLQNSRGSRMDDKCWMTGVDKLENIGRVMSGVRLRFGVDEPVVTVFFLGGEGGSPWVGPQ